MIPIHEEKKTTKLAYYVICKYQKTDTFQKQSKGFQRNKNELKNQ